MATAYSRFFAPASEFSACNAPPSVSLLVSCQARILTKNPSQMTRAEAALLSFSSLAQVALVADLDQAAEAEGAALVFFKGTLF